MASAASTRTQLLTIRQVADALQVSDKTIRRSIAARRLAAVRVGVQWRIAPRDLEEFLRRGRDGAW